MSPDPVDLQDVQILFDTNGVKYELVPTNTGSRIEVHDTEDEPLVFHFDITGSYITVTRGEQQ